MFLLRIILFLSSILSIDESDSISVPEYKELSLIYVYFYKKYKQVDFWFMFHIIDHKRIMFIEQAVMVDLSRMVSLRGGEWTLHCNLTPNHL